MTHNRIKRNRSAFGKILLEEFLEPYDISQKELAYLSGVHESIISNMVTGTRFAYNQTLNEHLYAIFKALFKLQLPILPNQAERLIETIHPKFLSSSQKATLIATLIKESIIEPLSVMKEETSLIGKDKGIEATRYLYDVALSFAGEDRDCAAALADILKRRGVKVFYDQYEKPFLWGKDLYAHLTDVYNNKASYCIIFLSQYYANKVWTKHELKAAQDRALKENKEYILPIRLDETEIPGILSTTAYLSWLSETAETIAETIMVKLGKISLSAYEDSALAQNRPQEQIVAKLVSEIKQGRNLVIAHRYPFERHRYTSRTITTSSLYEDLEYSAQTEEIVVVNFDYDDLLSGCYLPSYNLVERAKYVEEFSNYRSELNLAIRAYDAPYKDDLQFKSPWGTGTLGGVKLFAKIVRQLKKPTLAMLQHIFWEINDENGEPDYYYGAEIPALGSSMSVIFDIDEKTDWNRIIKLIDYFVDVSDESLEIHTGQRKTKY